MSLAGVLQQCQQINQNQTGLMQQALNCAQQGAQTAAQRNAAMTDPAVAQRYMSAVLVATAAESSDQKAQAAQNDITLASNLAQQATDRANDVALANQGVQAAHAQANVSFQAVDENQVVILLSTHHAQAEAFRQSAVNTANQTANLRPPAGANALAASGTQDSFDVAQSNARAACDDLRRAQRSAAAINPADPAITAPQAAFAQAAVQAANNPAVGNSIQNTRQAITNPPNMAALQNTIRQNGPANTAALDDVANRAGNSVPIAGHPPQIDPADIPGADRNARNYLRNFINRAANLDNDSTQTANDIQARTAAAAQAAMALAQHNQQQLQNAPPGQVAPLAALRQQAQAVKAAAQALSQQFPYNSNTNAADAKACIDASRAARACADRAAALLLEAQQAVQQLREALEAPYRERLAAGLRRVQELRQGLKTMATQALVATGPAAVAIQAALATQPSLPVGVQDCPFASKIRKQRALIDELNQRNQQDLQALRQITAAPPQIGMSPALANQLRQGQALLPLLQQLAQDLAPRADQARTAADQAQADKDQAVTKRITQLQAEGHGPQRHEGLVSLADLGERAVYKIDPETHTQIDAESGELHSADAVASKFNTNEVYVLAESMARQTLLARPNPNQSQDVLIPLAQIGPPNQIATGVESTWADNAQPRVPTTLGTARAIPTLQPFVAGSPPPMKPQMNGPAMQAEIAAHSQTVNFTGGNARAIYRRDANGNMYLRTMWSEKK
jgi:hypothetical protein